MDEETKKYIDDSVQGAKRYADTLKASYAKQDTAFQKYRREHPLAFQNILLFGYGPIMAFLGWLGGTFGK